MATVSKFLLQKIAEYITLSSNENEQLREELDSLNRIKTASETVQTEKMEKALSKVAKVLVASDWLMGDDEAQEFIKISKEDPTYPLRMLEKVCKAAEVSQIGSPARVAARPKQAEYDPVAAKAFGYNRSSIIDTL
jgi:hypothetical protein